MIFHKQDILFKGLGHAFIPDLFEYLEMLDKENNEDYKPLLCTEIKSLYSGELITSRHKSLHMDFVYLMADGSYLHFEHFSKNLTNRDIDKTLDYDVELHIKEEAIVDTVIIATGDPDKSKTGVAYSNFNDYQPAKTLFLENFDGSKRLKNLKNNIRNNNELTGFDILDMILIPFFCTGEDAEEVVIEICNLANEITNLTEEQEDKLFWGLWLTTQTFIKDKKTLEKVRTMTLVNGSSIYEILHKKEYECREEGRQEGRQEGEYNKQTKIANNMIERGFPVDQIAEITELDEDFVHQLTLGK